MKFKMYHSSIDVFNLNKSLDFYKKALGMDVMRVIETGSDEHKIIYIGTPDNENCMLELNWHAEKTDGYNLGDNSAHLGFRVDNYDEALAFHQEMGCVVEINHNFGVYFIKDPDGYLIEIVPTR